MDFGKLLKKFHSKKKIPKVNRTAIMNTSVVDRGESSD